MFKAGLLAAAIALQGTAAWAQGNVEHGKELATEYCARCHDVTSGGAFKTYPPSFASIAVYRAPDYIDARIRFPELHSGMPPMGFLLGRDDVEDLVAYIVSLEKTPE
jgi:mono/diheme cytochrome c family protein